MEEKIIRRGDLFYYDFGMKTNNKKDITTEE